NSSIVAANPVGSPSDDTIGRLDSAKVTSSNSNTCAQCGAPEPSEKDKKAEAKPMTAAPPKVPAEQPAVSERERKETTADEVTTTTGRAVALAKTRQEEDRRSRDMPAPASKAGPSRGPLQNQSNQINKDGVFEMSVTRKVGGKTFRNQIGRASCRERAQRS